VLAGLSPLSLRWALKENTERKDRANVGGQREGNGDGGRGAAMVAPRGGAVGEDGWTGQDQGSHDDASMKLG
jgi:hypothetical protein